VTVLDAYALLAYLRNESVAPLVGEILVGPTAVSAANLAEVVDILVRLHGQEEDDVNADIALLVFAGMDVAPVSDDHGVLAGLLRARHYDRHGVVITLADCMAAATALLGDVELASSDPALIALMRAEGGLVYPLPDSQGRLP
jgi:PIN domain nuclease of toxin-antitoxin system